METKLFQIFRAGTHTAMSGQTLNFSDTDLTVSAYAYSQKNKPAPLVLGHPDNDLPAYGHVVKLIAKADKLFAFAEVSETLLQMVREGRYKNVSAAFLGPLHPKNPVRGSWMLRHVGFLGAHPPAVKNMDRLEFSSQHDEAATCPVDFSESSYPSISGTVNKINEFRRVCPTLSYPEIVSLATR
jgi:hypothetical protein